MFFVIFNLILLFFLVTQGVRASLRAPQPIPGPTEHPASLVGRYDTAEVTSMYAETRTHVTEARKPCLCRWAISLGAFQFDS